MVTKDMKRRMKGGTNGGGKGVKLTKSLQPGMSCLGPAFRELLDFIPF